MLQKSVEYLVFWLKIFKNRFHANNNKVLRKC